MTGIEREDYKSIILMNGEAFYSLYHFNRFKKWIAKTFFKIQIKDIKKQVEED